MASQESNTLKKILLALSGRVVLWRNNRGVLTDRRGHKVRFGVGPNGASDLIGYRVVEITPEMVGQRIAQFAAVEVKKPGGRVKPEQSAFVAAIRTEGGVAGVADSVEAAEGIFK